MKATTLQPDTFESTLAKSSQPVLVDFWAEWCGPCRLLGPVIDEIAGEQGDNAVVAKINIDDAQELAMKYGVTSIPTLIVFKDGQPVARMQGVQPKDAIVNAITSAA